MHKIFVSHNQDFIPSRSVKVLIGMLGAHGVLVEDEPGAESPDKKSLRLLKECQGFLAICTNDLKGKSEEYSPKGNVALEIQEWQRIYGAKNMVIMKEENCMLPILLGNPTYTGTFTHLNFLDILLKACAEFQSMGLIPYKDGSAEIDQDLEFIPKFGMWHHKKKGLYFCHSCKTKNGYLSPLKEERDGFSCMVKDCQQWYQTATPNFPRYGATDDNDSWS